MSLHFEILGRENEEIRIYRHSIMEHKADQRMIMLRETDTDPTDHRAETIAEQQVELPQSADSNRSLMDQLKLSTTARHRAIERTRAMSSLFQDDLSLTTYTRLLTHLYGYYAALEPTLFSQLPEKAENTLKHRKKTALIAQDLKRLGLTNTEIEALPLCTRLPEAHSFAHKIGIFYVLEGATLGGTVIKRHLLAHFKKQNIFPPLAFYACYDSKTGMNWKQFKTFVDNWEPTQLIEQEASYYTDIVLRSANKTFKSFHNWLDEVPY